MEKILDDLICGVKFKSDIIKGLETSLEAGALKYIKYLWDDRDDLEVLHPWLKEAYFDLRKKTDK